MPVSLEAQQHIDKAKLFHSHWAGPQRFQMPLEWTVVTIYYEVLHWMSALVIHRYVQSGQPVPDVSLHSKLKKAMRGAGIQGDSQENLDYIELETLSRRARYEVDPALFVVNPDVKRAVKLYAALHAWASAELTTAGYTC